QARVTSGLTGTGIRTEGTTAGMKVTGRARRMAVPRGLRLAMKPGSTSTATGAEDTAASSIITSGIAATIAIITNTNATNTKTTNIRQLRVLNCFLVTVLGIPNAS